MDSFLAEQLKRIHELTEQMSRLGSRTAELNEEIRRDREVMHQSPLHDVRDLRPHGSQKARETSGGHAAERAHRPAPRRRRRR